MLDLDFPLHAPHGADLNTKGWLQEAALRCLLNNLDPPSRTAVAEALQRWPGAMIIVSHDPEFVQALAPERVLMMPEATLDHWDDDLLDLVSLA
jgi:hypothetical protein